jgi:hypothetical protein
MFPTEYFLQRSDDDRVFLLVCRFGSQAVPLLQIGRQPVVFGPISPKRDAGRYK